MIELNKVLLVGRLTRDPETRSIPSGASVTSFGIAVNRRRGKDQEDEASFIDCEAWDRQADFISQWFKKGKAIFVEGRLKMDRWQDKNTGQNQSKLKVVVERAGFVGGADNAEDGGSGGGQGGYGSGGGGYRRQGGGGSGERAPARGGSDRAPQGGGGGRHYEPDAGGPTDDDLPF